MSKGSATHNISENYMSSQQAHDVNAMSDRRACNVMTFLQRHIYVGATSWRLCNVTSVQRRWFDVACWVYCQEMTFRQAKAYSQILENIILL